MCEKLLPLLAEMSNPFSFLEFFRILWNVTSSSNGTTLDKSPVLRLPDTVVFLFGQPHEWYFTSKNGGPNKDRTTILKKRKANLTLNNIEEVFLTKAAAPSKRKKKAVKDNAIVAYFISSGGLESEVSDVGDDVTLRHQSQDGEVGYDIEYFDRQSLRESQSSCVCWPVLGLPTFILFTVLWSSPLVPVKMTFCRAEGATRAGSCNGLSPLMAEASTIPRSEPLGHRSCASLNGEGPSRNCTT